MLVDFAGWGNLVEERNLVVDIFVDDDALDMALEMDSAALEAM